MSLRHASEEDVDGNTTAIPDVPDAPSAASVTDVGTSRAFNNGAAYRWDESTKTWIEVVAAQ